ncbi:hypothetical protein KP509_13G042900 [Ceratopteris richardii]|uniref:Chromo domain-containing protein n=1 Tax=Ceratopteris richardii TaxID=49495 RepID=A0A8T2TD42_CERRI|nr:hypothetical protein KP509_13G042900 [Ceratopteris richardii]
MALNSQCYKMCHLRPPQMAVNPGYFGGGSVFQAMTMPAGLPGMLPSGQLNPLYANIGVQSGFRVAYGNPMMQGAHGVMAGFSEPSAQPHQNYMVPSRERMKASLPFLQAPVYDNLTPKSPKQKDYKEGGQAVKFQIFSGMHDRLKALTFIQQFDAAYTGGNFTESSKVWKAATFLKGNALQWWTTLLMQGLAPTTWIQFKQVFSSAWLTNTFEVDVMTAWHKLDAATCASLEEYNKKFWDALLSVSSYRTVPLSEQIVAHKERKVRGKVVRRYLVKFRNYSPMDAKWMEEEELADFPQILQLYKEVFFLESTMP